MTTRSPAKTLPAKSTSATRAASKKAAVKRASPPKKTADKVKPSAVGFPGGGDEMFEGAAELFRVLSAPMRLRILKNLCDGERNVSELLADIDTTQPNMSQHLNTLYKSGVLGKRREGVQIYYRVADERVVNLCKVVCNQVTVDLQLS